MIRDPEVLIAAAVAGSLDDEESAVLAAQARADAAVRRSLRLHLLIDEVAAQELDPARGPAAFAAGLAERRRAEGDGFAFLARVRGRIAAEARVRAVLAEAPVPAPLRLVRAVPWWSAVAAAAGLVAALLLLGGGGGAVAAEPAPASSVLSQSNQFDLYRRP